MPAPSGQSSGLQCGCTELTAWCPEGRTETNQHEGGQDEEVNWRMEGGGMENIYDAFNNSDKFFKNVEDGLRRRESEKAI